MLLLETLKYKINTHKIISFDIFDTLLLRPYVRPIDLFLHIEKLSNKEGFFEARRKAENNARLRINKKDKTELNKMKAKLEREKFEREAQKKYVGKHQYDMLKSVQTYFPY